MHQESFMNQASPPPTYFVLNNHARQSSYPCFEPLGKGGFGEVWGGFSNSGLPIAVKLWRPTSDPARDFSGWLNDKCVLISNRN
jgi:hypothetical protein